MPTLPRINKESAAFDDEYARFEQLALESSDEPPVILLITGQLENVASGDQNRIPIDFQDEVVGVSSTWVFAAGNVSFNLPSSSDFSVPRYEFYTDDSLYAPLILRSVDAGSFTLSARYPLVLIPERDESGTLVRAENEGLGISVFGKDRAELESLIEEQVIFLWNQYALEDNERLSNRALKLKERLLDFWRIDVHAAQK